MTGSFELRLWEDRLGAGATAAAPVGLANRILYGVEGDATVSGQALRPNTACHSVGPLTIAAGESGARLWRWELMPGQRASALVAGTPVSRLVFVQPIDLDPGRRYLIRCDRVDFPLGGVAYSHTHEGPGLRCLLRGRLTVETQGRTMPIRPGEAWFEYGPEPVYAAAAAAELTSFVRVLILPAGLVGKTSIRYVDPADQDKPKTQTYTVFVDQPIDLAA
jgi:hypothetical protein